MNRERRKEVAKVFFDLSKYLLTTVAVGTIFSKDMKIFTFGIAVLTSFVVLIIAYFITPQDNNNN